MTTISYATRQAESLELSQKHVQALEILQKAILSNAPQLCTIDIPAQSQRSAVGQESQQPKPDPSFLQTKAKKYGIQIPEQATVTDLSLPSTGALWVIKDEKNSNEQVYLVLRQAAQFSLHTLTVKCARLFAHCGEAYFQLGRTIPQKYNYQSDAIQDFESYANIALANLDVATTLKPDYAWAYAKKGEIYRVKGNRYGQLKDRMTDYDDALANFHQAIKLDQGYAWAHAHLGATICNAFKSEQYDKAQDHLQRALELMEGQYAWAIAYQGAIYLRQAVESTDTKSNLLEKALMNLFAAVIMDNRILEESVQPGLRHTNIYLAFAYLLLKQKQYPQAQYYCIQALQKAKPDKMDYVRAVYYMAVYFYERYRDKQPIKPPPPLRVLHGPQWWNFQSIADAHQALLGIANQILKDVEIEGSGNLTSTEKESLNSFSDDEKAAIEEVCTMLLITDVMTDEIAHTTTRITGHLPRILEILEALSPTWTHADPGKIHQWLIDHHNRDHVYTLIDKIIWKEQLPIEAIEEMMKQA